MRSVISLRGRLLDALWYGYGGRTVKGAAFERLLGSVRECLPIAELDPGVLADSLRHLAGVPLGRDLLEAECHRIAGNVHRLRHGRAAPPWHGQKFWEAVPVQIMATRPEPGKSGEPGARLTLKIMAGTPAGLTALQRWSNRRCAFHARDFGFTRRASSPYPYQVPEQLVTLRFHALVDPALSATEPFLCWPTIPRSGTVGEWNRLQLRRRFRVDPGYSCPQGFPASFPCHLCRFGYATCPAATHRFDYERRSCPACGRDDAFWDPAAPAAACVDCSRAAARRHGPGKGG